MGASSNLIRLTAANYADGVSALASGADPVQIASVVFDQTGDMPNTANLSDLFVSWGQFVDHDLSLTMDHSGEIVTVQGLVAPLQRSNYDETSGVREQVNAITPQMDASMIYGSDATRLAELRSFSGGRLEIGQNGLLPTTETGMAGASSAKPLFLAGDVRANENTGLTTLHTLFVNEHNHWADRLSQANPSWSDDQVFAASRSIVEAEIQKITYQDWLPHLVGKSVGPDTGFDPNVNGQISTEFSTAAFRFGHTMVSSSVLQMEQDGSTSAFGNIAVQDAFFNISKIQENGIDDILRGQAAGVAQAPDAVMIDDLNFFLQSPNGITGFSLAALNILRARDHGLGTYVDVRAALLGDIDPATLDPNDFSIITSDVAAQGRLAQVYASVHEVDLWVGGLAEDTMPGMQLGATFAHIVADQFVRTRAADDTFGDLDPLLSASIANEIANTTLSDIMMRASGVEYLQADVFTAAQRIVGDHHNDRLHGTHGDDLMIGLDGNDKLYGRKGDDALYGGNGRDYLKGNKGDDLLDGGAGNDRLYGGHGDDTLKGGEGSDRMYGGTGDDQLLGGAGHDRMFGGSGDDRLDGGSGYDYMHGGRGADTFVFSAGSGRDYIMDFRHDDTIELSGFGVTSFSELSAYATQHWFWLELDFGADELWIKSTHLWNLSENDFAFA